MQPSTRGVRPGRLTLPLLLLALSTLFLCNIDKGYLYRPGKHDGDTAKNLVIAENLSPDHNFRLFRKVRPGPGGAPVYQMYSRFPVGGHALIKLAILPFGNDLSARILAGRMLMLLLFSAAALLAFQSLARIISHRWVALAATLAAFSSWYMLYYGDAVSNEFAMELFAVMLVFHGMVVFVQEGRFRQLLARTCVALLLGWHVYAFLLPFLILGLASEATGAWKDGTAPWPRVRSVAAEVLRSRHMALGVFALLFGAVVLGFNFANEYAALGGETAVTELPSVQSMLMRTGLDQDFDAPFDRAWWLRFFRQQFLRVCVASVPSVLRDWGVDLLESFPSVRLSAPSLSGPALSVYVLSLLTVVAASTVVVFLARRLLARRRRMLLATLALSGFFWALPMRHNAGDPSHAHEALFYVGVPLVLYSVLLLCVHKRWGHGPVAGLAAAALLAFVVSAFRMEQRWRLDARTVEIQRTAAAEFGTIRETVRGKVVLVPGSVDPEWSGQVAQLHYLSDTGRRYYLAGSVRARSRDVEVAARAADFIISHDRVESDALLTPGNEQVFLYDSAGIDALVEFYRAAYQRAVYGEAAAHSYYDIHLGDDALTYVREPCFEEEARPWILVDMIPEDRKDLPGGRGSHNLVFRFEKPPVLFEGKCIAVFSLPDYPISGIRTGQSPTGHHGWVVEIPASR